MTDAQDQQVPITLCPGCLRWVPAHLDLFVRQSDGCEVGVWSCPYAECEHVFNLGENFDPEYVSPAECERRTGWTVAADQGATA